MGYTCDIDEFYEMERTESSNKNILIEGDSWVSHPFLNNLARQIDIIGSDDYNILNLSMPGDTAENILNSRGSQMKTLKRLLIEPNWRSKFDLIFLSAAGNDIVGPEVLGYVNDKQNYPNDYGRDLLKSDYFSVIDEIVNDYKSFITLKNSSEINNNTPIITHAYSYLYPRKVGTHIFGHMFNDGWVATYLEERNITEFDEQIDIVKCMIDYYYDQMSTINDDNFLIVDTRNILMNDNVPDVSKFFDEIHPKGRGFKKIAEVIYHESKDKNLWPV